MNRKQKQTLLVLVVLVAVLAVIALAVSGREDAPEDAADSPEEETAAVTETAAYTSLTYSNGSSTLSFAQDEEGRWIWADDPDFPLDDGTVATILDLITSLTPQQTITDGDTLEAYGLTDPSATLTASAADGTTLTLDLGNTTTDGDSYYMLMNGDESTVYIISDDLYRAMSVPIYDMCVLPQLPALTEENLLSISVTGAAQTVLTPDPAPEAGDSGADNETDGSDEAAAVTWRSGGEDVTENETVEDLLADLDGIAVLRCVDFKPTEEAAEICGFTAPPAVLEASYLDETGQEQTLTLTLGAALPDSETGNRYVRVGEDSTIYEIDGSAVDALLTLAENGLA